MTGVFKLFVFISHIIAFPKNIVINVCIGYSLLQEGPLPGFFSERQIQTIFTEDLEKTEMEQQFVQGIASLGLIQVCNKMGFLGML